jgi:LacI family transcriptional regulator
MARRQEPVKYQGNNSSHRPTSLKELAAHVGLSTTTLSLVLNASPGSESIPQDTQDRIFAAAVQFNYRPNFLARSLRAKRSYAIGVIVPELSDGYSSLVLAGIEDRLMDEGYVPLATSHRHSKHHLELLPSMLYQRCVEGLIAVDTPYELKIPLPIVSVSGHRSDAGVTNIVLNHDRAAELALAHLRANDHRRLAVIKGQSFSSDTEPRWLSTRKIARALGLMIDPACVVQLEGDSPSPETGYRATQQLLARGSKFTALFAFNDVSAFGAVRALQEHGLSVPLDVSVIGFDDIWGAAYHIPALTTIRQPLRAMGILAAETILARIREGDSASAPALLAVEPELIVRESTGRARHTE